MVTGNVMHQYAEFHVHWEGDENVLGLARKLGKGYHGMIISYRILGKLWNYGHENSSIARGAVGYCASNQKLCSKR